MSADWFVVVQGKETGPFSGAQLQQLAQRGEITPTTSVRQVRMPRAVPAAEVEGLLSVQISKPDPKAAPSVAAEDADPFVFWGLTAVAIIAVAIVGYFGWNRLTAENPGDEVVADAPVSGDADEPIPGPVARLPKRTETEQPSWEEGADATFKQQEQEERERLWRERVAALQAREAKADRTTSRSPKETEEEKEAARLAALEAQRIKAQQLIQAQADFVKDYRVFWARMQSLAKTREDKLIQPFYGTLKDAKDIIQEHKGRAREFKIAQLKAKLEALDKLFKAQENDYYNIEGELQRLENDATQLARSDRDYATFAQSWQQLHKVNQTAATVYDELGKSLEKCLNADPEQPIVIDYRKLVKARETSDSAMKKFRAVMVGLGPPPPGGNSP